MLIIGAGISGIGAAYRIHEKNPGLSYTVLERRERIGGTWDLFRYPGIRSDSDIFTLSFPFEPWTGRRIDRRRCRHLAVPDRDGAQARHRRATSASTPTSCPPTGIRQPTPGRCRPNRTAPTRPIAAGSCSSAPATTTTTSPTARNFLASRTSPARWCIPQYWPESLDYTGKRVVVIGSGATAVSMIPSLTEKAAHVTMLQRSPSYLLSLPRIDPVVQRYPKSAAAQGSPIRSVRWRNALFLLVYVSCSPASCQTSCKWVIRAPRHTQSARRLSTSTSHFKPLLQPVGSADVPDPRHRLVQSDQRRSR